MDIKWNVEKLPLPRIFADICSPEERDAFQAFLYRHGVLNTSTVLHTDTSTGANLLAKISDTPSWAGFTLHYGYTIEEETEKYYHPGDFIKYRSGDKAPNFAAHGRLVTLDNNSIVGILPSPSADTILMGIANLEMPPHGVSKTELESHFYITIID